MDATVKNEKTARAIINVLAENECTVREVPEILSYVHRAIEKFATVQKVNAELFETEE